MITNMDDTIINLCGPVFVFQKLKSIWICILYLKATADTRVIKANFREVFKFFIFRDRYLVSVCIFDKILHKKAVKMRYEFI